MKKKRGGRNNTFLMRDDAGKRKEKHEVVFLLYKNGKIEGLRRKRGGG